MYRCWRSAARSACGSGCGRRRKGAGKGWERGSSSRGGRSMPYDLSVIVPSYNKAEPLVERRVRVCPTCCIEKPIEEFYRGRWKCRPCYNEYAKDKNREWRSRNKEKLAQIKKSEYVRHKQVYLRRIKLWVEENRDKVKATHRRWNKNHPHRLREWDRARRAREHKAQGSFHQSDIETLLMKQRLRCAVCLKKLGQDFEVDHIIPLSKYGTNELKKHPNSMQELQSEEGK